MSVTRRPDPRRRAWGWRSALSAFALVVASGVGALGYGVQPLRFPASGVALLVGAAVAVAACWRWGMGRHSLPRGVAVAWLACALAALVAWYAAYEPRFAPGSDNADALARGARALLAGRNPYLAVTKLGSPLSPLLGGLLLAIPFVLIAGGLWWQQLAWLAAGAAGVWRAGGAGAAAVAATLFLVSPWSRMALPHQSDHWVAAVAVVGFGSWGYACLRDGARWPWRALSALGFGVALADRFTLLGAALPLAVALLRRVGLRRSAAWLGVAAATCVALLALPAAWGWAAYRRGPLGVGSSHALQGSVPFAGLIVAGVAALALALASWRVRCLADAWAATAVALAAMVAAVVATRLPGGLRAAVTAYDAVAFNGEWLVAGLAALVLPRD